MKNKKSQIKAMRRGSREAELEDEHGWKQKNKPYLNKKRYIRKIKHRREG